MLRLSTESVQHAGWVPVLLSQITSSSLEELAFGLAEFPVHREPVAWGSLAHVLERPSFYGLQRIYFNIRWRRGFDGQPGSALGYLHYTPEVLFLEDAKNAREKSFSAILVGSDCSPFQGLPKLFENTC